LIKLPDISIARSGTQLVVTLDNFEAGDTWNVYLGDDYISGFTEQVRGHDQPSYTITGLDAGANYILRVSLNNAPIEDSLTILSDDPDDTPPTITFEAIAPTTAAATTITKTVSWGADLVDLPAVVIDGFIEEWEPSGPRISIGDNQTL
jgi:hypothetical protein